MESLFFTTTSKLVLKNGWINEWPVVEKEPGYRLHSLLLIFLMVLYSIGSIREGRYTKSVFLMLAMFWVAPHLKRIYRVLFVDVWRQHIPLKGVRKVAWDNAFNELEERVVLTMRSGRKKVYVFRKREAQALPFVEAVAGSVPRSAVAAVTVTSDVA